MASDLVLLGVGRADPKVRRTAGFGGSWLDEVTGKLVVGITTGDRAAQVRRAGATPRSCDTAWTR